MRSLGVLLVDVRRKSAPIPSHTLAGTLAEQASSLKTCSSSVGRTQLW